MDKKDAITIGASLTGIDLEWVEGVRLKEMNEKSYPAVRAGPCDQLDQLRESNNATEMG